MALTVTYHIFIYSIKYSPFSAWRMQCAHVCVGLYVGFVYNVSVLMIYIHFSVVMFLETKKGYCVVGVVLKTIIYDNIHRYTTSVQAHISTLSLYLFLYFVSWIKKFFFYYFIFPFCLHPFGINYNNVCFCCVWLKRKIMVVWCVELHKQKISHYIFADRVRTLTFSLMFVR